VLDSQPQGVGQPKHWPRGFISYDSENAVGTVTWAAFDDAAIQDDSPTTADLPSAQSEYLFAINPGVAAKAIPAGATIVGFELRIRRRKSGTGTVNDTIVRLRSSSTPVGNNKASPTSWSSSYEWVTYRGPTDLQCLTPTRADALAITFALSCTGVGAPTAEVDYADLNIDSPAGRRRRQTCANGRARSCK
jgi:hypothetical protein